MTTVDIVLLVILGAATLYGLYKGLIGQIASLGGIVLGIIACRCLCDRVADLMQQLAPEALADRTIAMIVGCVLLYLLVYFTVGLFAGLIRKLTHALLLGWLDHLLGAVLGLFKWMILLSIVLNLWYFISPESPVFHSCTLLNGRLLPAIIRLAPQLLGAVTNHFTDAICYLTV